MEEELDGVWVEHIHLACPTVSFAVIQSPGMAVEETLTVVVIVIHPSRYVYTYMYMFQLQYHACVKIGL